MLLAQLGDGVDVDLWHYQTADGRSIRRALDYLIPFGLGKQKWTYQQLGDWPPQMLFPLLRRASSKYFDQEFTTALTKVPDVEASERTNLLAAPLGTRASRPPG
jgi:hypothetical protein